ncbi:STAS domain-containing protein [Deferribacter autotrophicus]|uniref:Anti-sigma factor antagonist n=1 Tax=Deferribacter autotrophicus TaxID=500465 RepID=A0A5A8F392_9BACT|nr:STAS domain-containing protein [Deferribacter autotrophicus]KAA0258605.1 STAS domain-containing protein [Deferribacter autotrophicus]
MKISKEVKNDLIIYKINTFRIDSTNVNDLKDKIVPDIKEGAKILLDLSSVDYMDSTSLSVLVFFHKEALKKNAKFRIVTNNEKVLSIFITTGLIRALEISKDLTEAINELSNAT